MTSAVAALPSQKFLKNKFPFSNASLDPLVKCSATSPSLTHVKLVKKILSENITERLPSFSTHTEAASQAVSADFPRWKFLKHFHLMISILTSRSDLFLCPH